MKQMTTGYSDAVQQAFCDWNERRAYVDNGSDAKYTAARQKTVATKV